MHGIKKFYAKNGITKANAEQAEETVGLGINAKTRNKDVHETEKKICVDLRIESTTKFELKCDSKKLVFRDLLFDSKLKSKTAIHYADTDEYYCDEFGLCEIEQLNKIEYYIINIENSKKLKSIKEEWEERKIDLTALCNHFGIDAKKYFYDEIQICRQLAYQNNKYLHGCEPVTMDEAKFLDDSFVGALNFADVGKEFTSGFGYDINSFYPWVMSQSEFAFPMSQGKIKKTKKIYDCEIRKLEIKGTHKYWRDSPNNYYDTYQIELLKLLEIPFEECPNEEKIIYKHSVKSKAMFSYFEDLYQMKTDGNKHAKLVLNCTHGQLSRKKRYEIDANNLQDHEIGKVVDYIEFRNVFVLEDKVKPFKFVFGRMKSFLASYVRLCLIRDYVLDVEKRGFEIYQIKTDSFVTNATPEDMVLNGDMGGLKMEKAYLGKHKVVNKKRIDEI
jgi:hypothetical protein